MISKFIAKHKIIFALVFIVIVIKIFLFFWAYFHFDFSKYTLENWLSIWDRWDSKAYKSIALFGYQKTLDIDYWSFKSHFPPLYPALIWFISLLGISVRVSGIFISLLASIVSSIVLYRVCLFEFGNSKKAFMSVLFFNLFPVSYFSVSVYSESLFILLAVTSFYFLIKGGDRLWLGGVLPGLLAGGAILTRMIGIVLIAVYFLHFLQDYIKNKKINWKIIWSFILPMAAVLIYILINKLYYGNYLFFLNENISFNASKHPILPFKESYDGLMIMFKNNNLLNRNFMMTTGWNAIFVSFAVLVLFFGVNKMRWQYTLYFLFSILIFSSLSWGISNARYVFSIFPIYMYLGSLRNNYLQGTILCVFAVGLLYFTKIFTSGAWAF